MVSYRAIDAIESYYGLTQSSNIGPGGVLLPTSVAFATGTPLRMKVRIPFTASTLTLAGEVVVSKEIMKDLVYNTRIRFCDLDLAASEQLADLVAGYKPVQLPTDGV